MNALRIRAAMSRQVDANKVAAKWLAHNNTYDKNVSPSDRAAAQDWVISNIKLDPDVLGSAVNQTIAEGYALGQLSASDALGVDIGIDWNTWQAGDAAAALLLDPPNGLQSLLDQSGATIKGIDETTMARLGSALAVAVQNGDNAHDTARAVDSVLSDPARAMTIAITETARAVSIASVDRYRENGIEQVEWLTADPCDDCQENEDAGPIALGDEFPSGDTEPPAHPNCRCAISPVINVDSTPADNGGADSGDGETGGGESVGPDEAGAVSAGDLVHDGTIVELPTVEDAVSRYASDTFIADGWVALTQEQKFEQAFQMLDKRYYLGFGSMNEKAEYLLKDRVTKYVIKNAEVVKNGKATISFAKKIPEVVQKDLIKEVEKLVIGTGKDEINVYVGFGTPKNAYGAAIRGDSTIYLDKQIFENIGPNPREGGSYKMPSLATTDQWRYTLSHEWGHCIDKVSRLTDEHTKLMIERDIKNLLKEYKDKAFVSGYGMTKPVELYAEMFAEFYNTGGLTDNLMVKAFAQKFDWKI